jgi:hypothetical protein
MYNHSTAFEIVVELELHVTGQSTALGMYQVKKTGIVFFDKLAEKCLLRTMALIAPFRLPASHFACPYRSIPCRINASATATYR